MRWANYWFRELVGDWRSPWSCRPSTYIQYIIARVFWNKRAYSNNTLYYRCKLHTHSSDMAGKCMVYTLFMCIINKSSGIVLFRHKYLRPIWECIWYPNVQL